MGIVATGITFVLLLLGVSLLFMRRPEKGKRDWPARFAMAALFAAIIYSSWLWQYSKFVNKHGLFYFISAVYGKLGLTVIALATFVVSVSTVWKDWDD